MHQALELRSTNTSTVLATFLPKRGKQAKKEICAYNLWFPLLYLCLSIFPVMTGVCFQVSVHYIGKLKKNGEIFDSNIGRAPFKFRLGDFYIEFKHIESVFGCHIYRGICKGKRK